MANYCVYIPNKGKDLFKQLKKEYGYSMAKEVFLRSINPTFKEDFKSSLKLDSEGVPTYESLMRNKFIKSVIGDKLRIEALEKQYPLQEDTVDNYNILLEYAYQFNNTNEQRDDFVAVVEHTDEGKLKVAIKPKTESTIKEFKEQYGASRLNAKLTSLFKDLGLTVEQLSQAEIDAGRVGVTDFSKAREIAEGFVSLIRVANNKEGAKALSEEFSHLIVGVFRNAPLVERAIKSLASNEEVLRRILGEDYDSTLEFHEGNMEDVAEEALGHILQKNLIQDTLSSESEIVNTPSPSLFERLYNWIIKQFSRYNSEDIEETINDVDTLMSNLARDILNGTKKITRDDIKNAQRDKQFNALSDRIEKNIAALKAAKDVELKRYRIANSEEVKDKSKAKVATLDTYLSPEADTAEGLLYYAKNALDELKKLQDTFRAENILSMTPENKFAFLRRVRMFTQSYGSFINSLNSIAISEEKESDNMFAEPITIGEEQIDIKEILKELNALSKDLSARYTEMALPAFAEFLKPFFGEEIVVPFGKYAGTKMSVESLLAEANQDISFLDRWLDSMANSSDTMLQLFDKAVKDAKGRARLNTIEDIKKIQIFREKWEREGITSHEWMFERLKDGSKSGNYISPVNQAQFDRDYQEKMEELDKKYGKNPIGPDAISKLEEKKAWLKENAAFMYGTPIANEEKYRNPDYYKLTAKQKQFLEEFLELKERYDAKYPENRVDKYKAIQKRKSSTQRTIDMLGNPSTIVENIKGSIASALLDQADDDQLFGERTAKGLTDFAGEEFLTLPVLYTSRLKDPNELSTDVIGSLMEYAYAANQYQEMDKIINPLEVGYTLVTDPNIRKVRETRGGIPLMEHLQALKNNSNLPIFKNNSNIVQKLKDFRESQIYGRYLKDEGTVLDSKVSTSKATSLLLKAASMAQLGFNFLANLGNVANGIAMLNIEAAAGQFFGTKELALADKEYSKHIMPKMFDSSNRNKSNKLDLFYELFNVKQDFEKKVKKDQSKSILRRLFGEDIAFIGQEAGDHWLYGRTAIAMAMREQVKLNGRKMSLWGALKVENVNGSSSVKQLNYKNITDLEGKPFDVEAFSRKIAKVNQACFGIYNEEDSNAANRVALGKLLQQYRKWMKPLFNRRFQAVQRDLTTGTWEEGYYRTLFRIMGQLKRGEIQLGQILGGNSKLTVEEQQNIKRALTEVAQFIALYALAHFIDWPDDKKRPWALKLAEYSCKRLSHELGSLVPTPVMAQELLKTVQKPLPSVTVPIDLINLIRSTYSPDAYTDIIKSGPYKGLNRVEKNLLKAPLPGVSQWRQINKFVGDVDTSIDFFARPY